MYYGRGKDRQIEEVRVTWEAFSQLVSRSTVGYVINWRRMRTLLGLEGDGPLRLIPR